MKIRARVIIRGHVQGVNYRHYTMVNAQRLNVAGWVRNLPDGTVEGCFEGEEADVQGLIEWCRTGPSWGKVDEVVVEREEYRGGFSGFQVMR